jgi:hypothetical protein
VVYVEAALRCARVLVVLLVAGCCARTALAEPFLTRNQNPLLALYGLPGPMPARLPPLDGGRAGGVINWSNTEKKVTPDDGSYTLDAEVFELRLQFDYTLRDRFAMHAELPWRRISGGSLDGFVDDWHGIFGLPGGSRRRLPEDRLLIEFSDVEATLLRFDASASGIGDIPVALGYQLHSDDRTALAAWMTVKVPTGSPDDLTGSGAVDVAATCAGQAQLHERWQVFGQVSVARLGKGDVLPGRQQSFAWTAMGGLTWYAWRALDLTVQVEANSRIYDDIAADLDGDAVVLTFGGSWRTKGGWKFDVGVSEDMQAGASPDVAFNFAAVRRHR